MKKNADRVWHFLSKHRLWEPKIHLLGYPKPFCVMPEAMMENRARNRNLHLRLTEKEWTKLQKQCARCHMKPQAYILKLIDEIQPIGFPPADYFDVLTNLRQINVNMNQIAVVANKNGFIDVKSYWDNVSELQRTYAILKRLTEAGLIDAPKNKSMILR